MTRVLSVRQVARLCQDEKGVTLVEYGIALIMMVTLGTVALAGLAGGVDARLDSACGTLDTNAANCAGNPD